jgi:hypothetical protein
MDYITRNASNGLGTQLCQSADGYRSYSVRLST